MMNAIILQMLQVSSRQLEQAVGGFTEAHWLHVPAQGLNCASWIVGHAILIDRQVLEELDVPSLPAIPDEWPSLYEVRPDDGLAREYHSGKFILAQFVTHRKVLIRAVSEVAADSLNRELEPPGEQRYNPLRGDEDNPLVRLQDFDGDGRKHVPLHVPTRRGIVRIAPIVGIANRQRLAALGHCDRYGHVDEVAALVAFVAGPESSCINGANLTIEGDTNA